MTSRSLFITHPDMDRLRDLLAGRMGRAGRDSEHLLALEDELDHAEVVSIDRIRPDVVTMHSRVRVHDLDTDNEAEYTIVFPNEANAHARRISVLAPIGTALLGCRQGDDIEFATPKGTLRLRIVAVTYQPEAAERVGVRVEASPLPGVSDMSVA